MGNSVSLFSKRKLTAVRLKSGSVAVTVSDNDSVFEIPLQSFMSNRTPAPIRFLDFDVFKLAKHIYRCPDFLDKTVPLESIDREHSLMIFVSHSWLRGDARDPNPDNADHDKYDLIVSGVEWIVRNMAPRMRKCYLWIDFSCVYQDNKDITYELERYDRVIQLCDLIFTPIVDHDPESKFPTLADDSLAEFQAKGWNDGPRAYLSRAWCRLEMLYAASLPLVPNRNGVPRHTQFACGLDFHCLNGRRPHLLYDNRRQAQMGGPVILPPLQGTFLTKYHPIRGVLTVPSDMALIVQHFAKITPYLSQALRECYSGERSPKGVRHGYGTQLFEDGSVYSGEWRHGAREGHGVLLLEDGCTYEGDWVGGRKTGLGTIRYANGDVYRGHVLDGVWHGTGTLRLLGGMTYLGEWVHGTKHGLGTQVYPDGSRFEGHFVNDRREGWGCYCDAAGQTTEGRWHHDRMIHVV